MKRPVSSFNRDLPRLPFKELYPANHQGGGNCGENATNNNDKIEYETEYETETRLDVSVLNGRQSTHRVFPWSGLDESQVVLFES